MPGNGEIRFGFFPGMRTAIPAGRSCRCLRPSLAYWKHAAGREVESGRCFNDQFLRLRITKTKRNKLSFYKVMEYKM